MGERVEVIGVIHLPRLPCSFSKPQVGLEEIVDQAVREARALEGLGYDGVIVENYGDAPYPKRVRDPLTISAMAVVVREVVRATRLKVGVNVLRNSGREAYAVAVAAGAKFVRVNALTETLVTDSGIVEPEAPRLRALRANYPWVEVYADLLVKHAGSLTFIATRETLLGSLFAAGEPGEALREALREMARDAVERGGANKIVVTGARTGEAPSPKMVRLLKELSGAPVVLGSGANPSNIHKYLGSIDGVIVGSYIKAGGVAGNRLDADRAREFIEAVRRQRV